MKTARLTPCLIVVVAVIASCAGGKPSAREATSTTTSPQLKPEPTSPRPGMLAPKTTPVINAAANGDTLAVRFTGGLDYCNVLDHVDVDERDDAVTLRVLVGTDPAAPKGPDGTITCQGGGVYRTTDVQLQRSLGTRKLIDGHDGSIVAVAE